MEYKNEVRIDGERYPLVEGGCKECVFEDRCKKTGINICMLAFGDRAAGKCFKWIDNIQD